MLKRLASERLVVSRFHRRPDRLNGYARVIDGDTIIVAGERIRLHGIDAPEMDQMFWRAGERLPSGAMAAAALETLTAGVKLRCEIIERDRHGRIVAKCFSPNGVDIGRRLVSAGWALAYRRYSMEYVSAEREARKAKRGLWKGRFMKPWAWRAKTARRAGDARESMACGGASLTSRPVSIRRLAILPRRA